MSITFHRILSALQAPLPGEKAHQLMMPQNRKLPQTSNHPLTNAGVLILIYPKQDTLYTVFMKRVVYNGAHSGQISFPGGKEEVYDTNLRCTALRETEEEIGVAQHHVKNIIPLTELTIPVSQFKVHPFVGFVNNTPTFKLDPGEVQYIIEAPLHYLIDPKCILTTSMSIRGSNFEVPYFDVNNEVIWGATAMILSEFIYLLKQV